MKILFLLLILSAIIVDNPDIIIKDGGVNTSYEEATKLEDGELK